MPVNMVPKYEPVVEAGVASGGEDGMGSSAD